MIDLKTVKNASSYGVSDGAGGVKGYTSDYYAWCGVLRHNEGFIKDADGNWIQAELISHTGGYEEDEEECTSILMIGDQYFKFDYGYRSSEGYDYTWMDVREVKPVQKVVTVYE